MSSILTNTAALNALKQLSNTNQALQETQGRISSGLRVGSAGDNAAYWSIATTMRSDDSSIKSANDALGLGASAVAIAYNGTNSAISIAQKIKDKLVSALQPGVDRTKVQSEITQLQSELKSTADASSFSGQNYLSVDSSATGYNATASIISSYTRTSSGVKVGTIDISVTGSKLYDANDQSGILDKTFTIGTGTPAATTSVATLDISALTDSTADIAKLNDMIKGVDGAVSSMTTSAANLGSAQTRIKDQQSFLTNLSSSIESGISALVDADMTQESTRLQALQVQQQLGTQALSIANQSSQSILSLFR